MSPVYKRDEAKKGGFTQVRSALQSFKGKVVKVETGQWGGKLIDEDGNPVPPKEFFEVECQDNTPLEVTEELSMDISERFTFRVNMSDWEGSFWIDEFLASADKVGILLPDGLLNKVVTWKRVTKSWDIDGIPRSYTNYVIDKVEATPKAAPRVVPKAVTAAITQAEPAAETVPAQAKPAVDPMEAALKLAIGKTEQQFRAAIALDPTFIGNPLLPMAKAGVVTQALINEGKLVLVKEGDKEVYRKPS